MAVLGDIIGYGLAAARPSAGTEGRLYYSTDSDALERDNGSTWDALTPSMVGQVSTLNFIIDGGGSTITTGVKGDLVVDFACTITGCKLYADQTGSIVVDLWKDTDANFPPLVADTITASAKPTISSSNKGGSNLSGWTTSISAGDILRVNVDSVTSLQKVTLALKVSRS